MDAPCSSGSQKRDFLFSVCSEIASAYKFMAAVRLNFLSSTDNDTLGYRKFLQSDTCLHSQILVIDCILASCCTSLITVWLKHVACRNESARWKFRIRTVFNDVLNCLMLGDKHLIFGARWV
jgi:hypothetical protein